MTTQRTPDKQSIAMECQAVGCQHGNAHKLIQELRAENAALFAECAHYRQKLRDLAHSARAALTVTKS